MALPNTLLADILTTLVGIFSGTLLALALDRHNERRRKRQRAATVLRSLMQELGENDTVLRAAKPTYLSTAWGKSFYVSTIAWETALSSGDLPDIIGFELTDAISAQYALLVRIRYYVGLLTQLWLAPADIDGYESIRAGFREAILSSLNRAINNHPELLRRIQQALPLTQAQKRQ